METTLYTRVAKTTSSCPLNAERQATIGTDQITGTPSKLWVTYSCNGTSNLLLIRSSPTELVSQLPHLGAVRLTDGYQRGHRVPHCQLPLHIFRGRQVHVRHDWARVDGVDRCALGKLSAPNTGEGLEGGLGPRVETRARQSDLRVDTGHHDDAPRPVGGQVGLARRGEDRGPQDVHGVDVLELRLDDGLQGPQVEHRGIVDEDVDLEGARVGAGKVLLGDFNDLVALGSLADVRADGHSLDAVIRLELRRERCGWLVRGLGGIVDDDIAALACEVANDCGSDTWTRLAFMLRIYGFGCRVCGRMASFSTYFLLSQSR